MSARYVPNHKEFGQLMMSDQIRDVALEAAGDVVDVAKERFAPVGPRDEDETKPRYIDSFDTASTVVTINGSPRRSADALNTADHSARVEFGGGEGRPQGGSHGPAQRPLGRAGAVIGDYRGGAPA